MLSGDVLRNDPVPVAVVERRFAYIGLLVVTVCVIAGAVFYANGELHHDPSFLLVATRRWLDGATLYRDIVEINPPLIFYLTAPAVLISNLLRVSDATVFILCVCGAAAVSLAWCSSLLAR